MVANVLWARHGQNAANLTKTLSYRVFDGDLTGIVGHRLGAAPGAHGGGTQQRGGALTAVAHSSGEGRSLVVAHGASLRAALPCLAGEPDPAANLPTGAVAGLHVHPGGLPAVRLVSRPGAAPG